MAKRKGRPQRMRAAPQRSVALSNTFYHALPGRGGAAGGPAGRDLAAVLAGAGRRQQGPPGGPAEAEASEGIKRAEALLGETWVLEAVRELPKRGSAPTENYR